MKKRKSNDQNIKEVLHAWVESLKYKGKFNQSKIKMIWADVMGASINNQTQDMLLVRKKLSVTINSSVLKQELSYGRDKIKNLLNEELGAELISEVIIR